MRRLFAIWMFVFLLAAHSSATPHRLTLYPAPFTILSIAEGPEGFLWLATSNGLYRFDGLHFRKISSYPFVDARVVAFTGDGSLWVGSYEGLARARPGKPFEIILSKRDVMSLTAFRDQIFLKSDTLIQIGVNGVIRELDHKLRRDLLVDASGRLWGVCLKPDVACWLDPAKPEILHRVDSVHGYQAAVPDPAGGLWLANDEEAVLIRDKEVSRLRRQPTLERRRQGPLVAGSAGQLWFLGEQIRGMNPDLTFRDRPSNDRFPPTAGFQDSRGDLWVAYLGQGLAKWSVDRDWHKWFPEDLDNAAPVQVIREHNGSLVLSTHKHLYRWNSSSEKWMPFTSGEHRFDGVLALEDGGFLASLRDLGVARISSDGRLVEVIRDSPSLPIAYREILRDGKGQIWIAAKRALHRLEGQPGALSLRAVHLPGEPLNGTEQAVDLEMDSAGRLWVGYQSGIAWLGDDEQWHTLSTDQPVTSVRSFALAGDDIWVAHRRAGSFSRLHRNGAVWKVTLMSAGSGYSPTDTNFLKRDSRGWIWRGSTSGIHISDGLHFGPNDWIHIPLEKGLAANETEIYGFFEDKDGSVWIAGDEGLTHLNPNPSWFSAPSKAGAPQITYAEADGKAFLFPDAIPQDFPLNPQKLLFEVGGLNGPEFRDGPIRYRLSPDKEWRFSQNGTLEFLGLGEQAYTLELGWTGGNPSSVRSYPLRVGAPPARSFGWRWLLGALLGAAAMTAVFRYTSWPDVPKFKVEKAIFMLRRRYESRARGEALDPPEFPSDLLLAGRYRLSRVISRGGFSQVFEAWDSRENDRRVAVKILNIPAGQDRGVRQRFAQEVAALRSVQHPGVVPILDSWIGTDGEPCLAMPFLDGQTVRQALEGGPLETNRAGRIVQQIGAALAEVHSHGIVHRDLKPENLMLTSPGTDAERAVIIDFGTAGLRAAENRLAATTSLAGSFHYMAPERLAGRYSPASDIFSFAVTILELLTGKRLSDLPSTTSDRRFQDDIELALREVLPPASAARMALELTRAFDADPLKRPASVLDWSSNLAELCVHS